MFMQKRGVYRAFFCLKTSISEQCGAYLRDKPARLSDRLRLVRAGYGLLKMEFSGLPYQQCVLGSVWGLT